jgi:hypothetical protein
MADFAPQMFFFKFHKQYEDVMSSLNKEAVPKEMISKIKNYFNFVWTNSKGINYSEFLGGLPPCLNSDILFSRYSEAIKNSIIFKNKFDQIDTALTNSILSCLEYRVYMDGDFIVIGGSSSMNTYIILEGEAIVFGLNEEFIAYIRSGGHYSNDLEDDDEEVFEYKRPLHIVSKGISIVGILSINKLTKLYMAYPDFKKTLRALNKHFVSYVSKFCKKYLKSKDTKYSVPNITKLIADHYSYSTSVVYDSINKKLANIDSNSLEVLRFDIIKKQKEVMKKKHSNRRSSLLIDKTNLDAFNTAIFKEENNNKSCWNWLVFKRDSTWRRIIDLVHLINLIFISISIPLVI